MKIQWNDKINITMKRKEADRLVEWMKDSGLAYEKIVNGNLLNNPVGEFFVKLVDFLEEGEE